MLNLRPKPNGFSLVELLIGIAILGVLAAMAAPALSSWIQNAQIRATADAIQNGLQLARGEAVRLNTTMRFQLMTSADNTCQQYAAGAASLSSNWVVSQGDPALSPLACATPATNTAVAQNDPLIVQVRSGGEGSGNIAVSGGQSLITFNGLGRATNVPTPPGTASFSATTNPSSNCLPPLGTGLTKCLNVVVSSGGQIRMCDPSLSQTTNPRGC